MLNFFEYTNVDITPNRIALGLNLNDFEKLLDEYLVINYNECLILLNTAQYPYTLYLPNTFLIFENLD